MALWRRSVANCSFNSSLDRWFEITSLYLRQRVRFCYMYAMCRGWLYQSTPTNTYALNGVVCNCAYEVTTAWNIVREDLQVTTNTNADFIGLPVMRFNIELEKVINTRIIKFRLIPHSSDWSLKNKNDCILLRREVKLAVVCARTYT